MLALFAISSPLLLNQGGFETRPYTHREVRKP
jgi:hypothetical protein